MAVRHSALSTGYETLAYADVSATREKQATHYVITSDDEMDGQPTAPVKQPLPNGKASSTNESPIGTGSRRDAKKWNLRNKHWAIDNEWKITQPLMIRLKFCNKVLVCRIFAQGNRPSLNAYCKAKT